MKKNKPIKVCDGCKIHELWMADLPICGGSVQAGKRPVLVISNDRNNQYAPAVGILPLTTKRKKPLPVHVGLEQFSRYGLSRYSTVLAEQIMTIPKECLVEKIGTIGDSLTLGRIADAMAVQLSFEKFMF